MGGGEGGDVVMVGIRKDSSLDTSLEQVEILQTF